MLGMGEGKEGEGNCENSNLGRINKAKEVILGACWLVMLSAKTRQSVSVPRSKKKKKKKQQNHYFSVELTEIKLFG